MKVKVEWVKLPRSIPENMGLEEFETDQLRIEIERDDGSEESFFITDHPLFKKTFERRESI